MTSGAVALERAGGGAANPALGDRDAKVIRPERGQPLDEADRRRTRLFEPRLRFGAKESLLGPRLVHHRRRRRGVGRRRRDQGGDARSRHGERGEARRLLAVALLLAAPIVIVDGLQDPQRRKEVGALDPRPFLCREFRDQRLTRIARADRPWPRAEAESVERQGPRAVRGDHRPLRRLRPPARAIDDRQD